MMFPFHQLLCLLRSRVLLFLPQYSIVPVLYRIPWIEERNVHHDHDVRIQPPPQLQPQLQPPLQPPQPPHETNEEQLKSNNSNNSNNSINSSNSSSTVCYVTLLKVVYQGIFFAPRLFF